MAKVKTVKPETLEALKQAYLTLGEAYQAIKSQDKYMEEVVNLRATVKSQEQKISDLLVRIKGYESHTEKRLLVCPECLGSGAYIINGEVEECDRCDTNGWIPSIPVNKWIDK